MAAAAILSKLTELRKVDSVSKRCQVMGKMIKDSLEGPEGQTALFNCLPQLLGDIFGLESRGAQSASLSWVASCKNDRDVRALVAFLSPDTPLFSTILWASISRAYNAVSEMIFPIQYLPEASRVLLTSRDRSVRLPPLYRDRKITHDRTAIEISVLEYFFFCFAYFATSSSTSFVSSATPISFMGISTKHKSAAKTRRDVFRSLSKVYIRSFIQVARPSGTTPPFALDAFVAKVLHGAAGPVSASSVAASGLGLSGTGDKEVQAVVRKISETTLLIFNDFWLCRNRYESGRKPLNYTIPSFESALSLKVLVEHLAGDLDLAAALQLGTEAGLGSIAARRSMIGSPSASASFSASSSPFRSSSSFVGYRPATPPLFVIQPPLYRFLRHGFAIETSTGASLRNFVDIWLVYIQPWRRHKSGELADLTTWRPYVGNSLLFYVTLFRAALERLVGSSFSSISKSSSEPRNILAALLAPFAPDASGVSPLGQIVASLEQSAASDNYIRSHIHLVEGGPVRPPAVFIRSRSMKVVVAQLIFAVRAARHELTGHAPQASPAASSFGSSVLVRFGGHSGKSNPAAQTPSSVATDLAGLEAALFAIFAVHDLDDLRETELSVSRGAAVATDAIHESDNSLRLTRAGRQQVRSGAIKCSSLDDVPVLGDPDLVRITSTEFGFLVRATFAAAAALNAHFGLPAPADSVPLVARVGLAIDAAGDTLFSVHGDTASLAAAPSPNRKFRLRWLAAKPTWATFAVLAFLVYIVKRVLFG
ncbi:uncharacterized protein AMSG_01234 [Thecamonas trahens ATCC 50062]|uniref:Sphingomyelin phosphodiesterase 4 n=1 Tax=Thecamonas trahens ATCC 50062 TaxID=461836 RepID=A0A0L0DNC6_THETB|nr:hypothetical protein AMSG_01234 [Thecamonas trahens ATCC 50062]KNC53521.1 hypothetical protein AMSG_01234 [Thecamonas trahens ATCC 50062]|eukprot:XP_013761842.1 hypothetical protein AMSG_01234 [Thecamonas trahens ATCC 50062]